MAPTPAPAPAAAKPRSSRRGWQIVGGAFLFAVIVTAGCFLRLVNKSSPIAGEPAEPPPTGPCRLELEKKREPGHTVLLYYGDSGSGTPASYVVGRSMARVCHDRCCDVAVAAGDNIYMNGVKRADDPQFEPKFEKLVSHTLSPTGAPLLHYMTLGNHDMRGDVQAEIDHSKLFPRWRMLARYYAVPDLPPYVAVFVINSNDKQPTEQLAWLKKAACDSPARWKFFLGHHPVTSVGEHGENQHMRYLLDVAKECNVAGYLAGHDHDQQHITLKLADGRPFEQFVSGSVGFRRDDVEVCLQKSDATCQKRTTAAQTVNFSHPDQGFAVVDVSAAGFKVSFHDGLGKALYQHETRAP